MRTHLFYSFFCGFFCGAGPSSCSGLFSYCSKKHTKVNGQTMFRKKSKKQKWSGGDGSEGWVVGTLRAFTYAQYMSSWESEGDEFFSRNYKLYTNNRQYYSNTLLNRSTGSAGLTPVVV